MFKIKLSTFILIFYTSISFGQNVFHKTYNGVGNFSMSREMGFIQTNDNGYLMGNVRTLMKIDSTGDQEWRYDFTIPGWQQICAFSIINDFNNGYLLSGTRMFLSLDSNYNINWMKDITSNYYFYVVDSKKADSTSYFHAGLAGPGNNYRPSLVKIDTLGNIIWAKIYNSNPIVESIKSMDVASDGSIYMVGVSKSVINPTGYYDGVVLKLNSDGTLQWANGYANLTTTLGLNRIKTTLDGNLIITGKRNLHRFLMKIDTSGNIIWQKFYSSGINGNAIDVFCTPDSGYALVGEVSDTTTGGTGQTSIFIKTDSIGNLEFAKYLGGFGNVSASRIVQTPDNGFAIAGRRYDGNNYILNFIKTDSLGNTGGCLESNATVTVTSLYDTVINFFVSDSIISATTVPYTNTFPLVGTEVDLCNFQGLNENDHSSAFEIYPNPSLGAFNIRFTTPISDTAIIGIYALSGKKLYEMELARGHKEYKVNFNPEQAGIYFINVKSEGKNIFKKIIIFQD